MMISTSINTRKVCYVPGELHGWWKHWPVFFRAKLTSHFLPPRMTDLMMTTNCYYLRVRLLYGQLWIMNEWWPNATTLLSLTWALKYQSRQHWPLLHTSRRKAGCLFLYIINQTIWQLKHVKNKKLNFYFRRTFGLTKPSSAVVFSCLSCQTIRLIIHNQQFVCTNYPHYNQIITIYRILFQTCSQRTYILCSWQQLIEKKIYLF